MKRVYVVCVLALVAGSIALAPARGTQHYGRLAGNDRIATAIAISRQVFTPADTATVLLARSDDFPDALAGAPLADYTGAPILLTPSDRLEPRVLAEIERLAPQVVLLLGGPAALSPEVGSALPATVLQYRFNGQDRYETAALIDQVMNDAGNSNRTAAVVASGQRFPDALMAMDLLPPRILLSRQDRFEDYVPRYSYTLVGGPAVLGDAILTQTGGTRLGGADRYETSALVLDTALGTRPAGPLFLATGRTAPDALAAGAAVGETRGYLLIVDPVQGPTPEQDAVLTANAALFTELWVLGGVQAMPEATAAEVADLIGLNDEPTPSPSPSPTLTPPVEPTDGPTDVGTEDMTDEGTEDTTEGVDDGATEEATGGQDALVDAVRP